jgi:hypothetical protein
VADAGAHRRWRSGGRGGATAGGGAVAGARRLDRLGGSDGRPVAERLGGSVAGAVAGGVDWPLASMAKRWRSGGRWRRWHGAVAAPSIGRATAMLAAESSSRVVDCFEMLSVCSGEEGGRAAALYTPPPFSPGWWLQPGLKTFGRRFAVRARAPDL